MKSMPPYTIHLSMRCRRSTSLNNLSESPTLLSTSSIFRWADCTPHNACEASNVP